MTNTRSADTTDPKELSARGTGVDLQKLIGQKDYLGWKRDFKLVAQAKGLWGIIDGIEDIPGKPDRLSQRKMDAPTTSGCEFDVI